MVQIEDIDSNVNAKLVGVWYGLPISIASVILYPW